MAGVLQHLRSSTLNKRPNPASMVDGQVAINYASGSPGMFFKDSSGALVKVGPVHVGSGAPNVSPASGGTAGNSLGEQWLDTSGGTYVFKIWDGSAWRSEAGEFVNVTGDTMTGALGIIAGSASTPGLFFSGDTNTGIYSPGADQVAVATSGAGRVFVNNTGLGVGIAAGKSIDVYKSDAAGQAILRLSDVDSRNVELRSPDGLGNTAGVGTVTNHDFIGFTGNTERLRITSAGLVGVGTSSVNANSQVHVVGSSYQPLYVDTTGVGGGGAVFLRSGTQALYVGTAGSSWLSSSSTADGLIRSEANLVLATNGNNRAVTIDTSQRVGIGTTSPGHALDVVGDIRANPASGNSAIRLGRAGADRWAIYTDTSHNLNFYSDVANSLRATIDSSGRLLVGTSSSRNVGSSGATLLQLESTSYRFFSTVQNSNDAFGSQLYLGKSRGSTVGSSTAVQSGDEIGYIGFAAADGTDVESVCAAISAVIDSTPGSNDVPGRLVFSVTRDGASSPTEALRISNSGRVDITSNQAVSGLAVTNTNASFGSTGIYAAISRAANSAYDLLGGYSSGESDAEFRARGDGNTFCDGAFTGGGADYAEYFEWSDSNHDEEDRRGISVVLDDDKIRKAQAGEDPIGVISGNPSVVGDAAWNKWSGKYLRDEFGSYLLDENGDRQLNPDFDPDAQYIPREQRPEWDCVGLMGKLRIRKDQVTGSRWIKMRDISDSVEEWLVR